MFRKSILRVLTMLLLSLVVAGPALADSYPSRPITLLVPWGAGGGTDAVARIVAAMLDDLLLFGMGYSWGGYESLIIPFDCSTYRTVTH